MIWEAAPRRTARKREAPVPPTAKNNIVGYNNILNLVMGKIKIEVVLGDSVVSPAVEAIIKAAKTGKIGDGKVFVSSIENAIRIRTEETGEQAV